MKLHPLETTERIRESYIRYLKTLFPINEPTLAREFETALLAPEMLVKGPLVEISPAFKRENSIQDLVEEGVLHDAFSELCSDSELPYGRKLYRHQELAIRKAAAGRNLVVATGTGSGKTEAFLIPLFDYLLRERAAGTLSQPGVRALLLYPMNALANDQLKRLRKLLAHFPDITFGRYTGETEQQRTKAEDKFRKNHPYDTPLRNELLSREEMQARPPHLLLTNYAMLEYLLLRPQDAPFFDGDTARHWRYIVLDEAHVYDGAQAIEIGMLLRRLKDRVVQSEPGRLKVIATSATIGRGREDFPAVRDFATNLFGEPFEWNDADPARQDVVEAARVPIDSLGPTWGRGNGELYTALRALTDNDATPDAAALGAALAAHEVPDQVFQAAVLHARENGSLRVKHFLHSILLGDESLRALHRALTERPRLLHEVAAEVFPNDDQAANAVVDLVALAVHARPGEEEAPLLPARYHLFARALEGAFVCLNEAAHGPDDTEQSPPRLYLNRYERCAHEACSSRVFEMAQCPRCGTAYLIGTTHAGRELVPDPDNPLDPDVVYLVHEAPRSQNLAAVQTEYFMLDSDVSDQEDEDELVATEADTDDVDRSRVETYTVCVKCGAVAPGADQHPGCSHSRENLRGLLRVHAHGQTLTRCVKCGVQGRGGVLYRFLTGQDAPVSVLATALYQEVPPSKDESARTLPGQGRKMLMFADSRQDAAFFAPYLERTYGGILRRRLILKTLTEDEDGRSGRLRIQDIIGRVLRNAEDYEFFRQTQSYDERKREVAIWMALELIALDRRISLEGVGLLRIALVKPRGWEPPPPLLEPPWNLDSEEAWNLIAVLLDSLRRQGVVTLPDGVDPRSPQFAPRDRSYFVRHGDADSKQSIFGWMPKRGHNARLNFLIRWLQAHRSEISPDEAEDAARDVLEGLWRYLSAPGMWTDHLPMQHDSRRGVVHQLSHKMWEFQPTLDSPESWHICNRCANLSSLNVGGICPTYRCEGKLEPYAETAAYARENHYRRLYAELDPIPLSTEEHTAQLATQAAAEIQDRFVRGEVNALSCSTTFELGVDVGDLQTVLLRNVPPTTANYVQRAGRAGRRLDTAAFALTFAQRRSHDLTFYGQPEKMVAGKINPPVVALTNEKIVRRHVHSVAFAAFFRDRYRTQNIDYRKVGDFFEPNSETGTNGPDALRTYLGVEPAHIRAALKRIVPEPLHGEIGVTDWGWVRLLTNASGDGVLDKAESEISSDLEQIAAMEQEAASEGRYGEARHFQQVLRNIRSRFLLGELARRNVLPKYGFPVDVVELKTSHLRHVPEASRVELDRDLKVAISEYAPGGQVVAAKVLWESVGLRLLPGRQLDEFNYAVCPRCQRFHFQRGDVGATCTCGESLVSGRNRLRGKFIVPEHGFVAGSHTLQPGESRPQRMFSSRVFFAEYRQPVEGSEAEVLELEPDDLTSSSALQVFKGHSRYGWLAMVNAGNFGMGYRLCQTCGFAEAIRRGSRAHKHANPITDRECRGTQYTYHLGHRYMTDVVELRFAGLLAASAPERLWRSLLYALLEGASEALGVRRDDIDGTMFHKRWGEPPSLILFDSVPGGAGHVRRIIDNLPAVFEAAYRRVATCKCGPETSCYECLRNYYNQYLHADLQRGPVEVFLAEALAAANLAAPA